MEKKHAKGFCSRHYTDFKRNKIDINGKPIDINKRPRCKKCLSTNIASQGLCWKHYRHSFLENKPLENKPLENKPLENKPLETSDRLLTNWSFLSFDKKSEFLKIVSNNKKLLMRIYNRKDSENSLKLLCKTYLENLGVENFECKIIGCKNKNRTQKKTPLVRGFCGYHYNQFNAGIIDIDGNILRPLIKNRNKNYGNKKLKSIWDFNKIINRLVLSRHHVLDALKNAHSEIDHPDKELILNKLFKLNQLGPCL